MQFTKAAVGEPCSSSAIGYIVFCSGDIGAVEGVTKAIWGAAQCDMVTASVTAVARDKGEGLKSETNCWKG